MKDRTNLWTVADHRSSTVPAAVGFPSMFFIAEVDFVWYYQHLFSISANHTRKTSRWSQPVSIPNHQNQLRVTDHDHPTRPSMTSNHGKTYQLRLSMTMTDTSKLLSKTAARPDRRNSACSAASVTAVTRGGPVEKLYPHGALETMEVEVLKVLIDHVLKKSIK